MTTGKTIALTRRTFVDKVMSLLFNMLYRLIITFLPKSTHLLISWQQSPSAVILEPPKIVSHCFYTLCIHFCIHLFQFSVTESCPNFWDPMNCTTPGFPVYHHLLQLAQTHVHWVSDVLQSSHPLSSPSPPAFNLSQHHTLQMSQFFISGGQSIGVLASTSVLPMNIQD